MYVFFLLFLLFSEYKRVPPHLKDEDVLPSVTELSLRFLASVRSPRRRAVSIGPQSEADAYEALAYRQKKRRDSMSSAGDAADDHHFAANPTTSPPPTSNISSSSSSPFLSSSSSSSTSTGSATDAGNAITGRPAHHIGEVGGNAAAPSSPLLSVRQAETADASQRLRSSAKAEDEAEQTAIARDAAEIFAQVPKPRVRYDVEVATKLTVYAGMVLCVVVL